MNIGERIRKYRKACGMTQSEVANAIGVTKQAIYKYEHSIVTNIGIETLDKISAALGISVINLIGGSDDTSAPKGARKSIESVTHTEKFRELCERHINHADLIHETDGYLSRRLSTLRIKEASASRSNSSSDEL